MRLVIVETPYAGDVDTHVCYARAAMHDCLMRGEAPMASHLLYTQPGVLDDEVPDQREIGIEAGLAWGRVCQATVVYIDLGISEGMDHGIYRAHQAGRPVEYRRLPEWDQPQVRQSPGDSAMLSSKPGVEHPVTATKS